MSQQVQTIKDRLSIVDVLSSYITLEPSGSNYKARCPFHNEKTPSFYVSAERNSYYCFGCGARGDIFSFVQNFEGTDFIGSLKLLAEKAGVTLSYEGSSSKKDDYSRLYKALEEATDFFEKKLQQTPEAIKYLHDRGLTDETIKNFHIGYVPQEWRSVSVYLLEKGYTVDELEKVGLIKKNGDKQYDRFRGRIMFPIADSSGRIIAFSGRVFLLSSDDKTGNEEVAKYLNSPDTVLFNKSHVLFGIDRAKLAIRSRGYSIIVEGQMDLVLSHQAGFANTVATSGTAFTKETHIDSVTVNNLGLIKRLSPNIIFAFDGDNAGIRALNKAAVIALSLDMQVKTVILLDKKDPADTIAENPDTWKECVKNSKNIITFHIDRICELENDVQIRGKKIRETIFPFLIQIKSEIDRSSYIQEIHNKTGIPVSAISKDFDLFLKNNINTEQITINENTKNIPLVSKKEYLQRKIFGILFWLEKTEITGFEFDKNKKYLQDMLGEEVFIQLEELYKSKSDELSFEAEMWYSNKNINISYDYISMVDALEEFILTEKNQSLLIEINQKEQSGQKEKLNDLLILYQQNIARIEIIKTKRL